MQRFEFYNTGKIERIHRKELAGDGSDGNVLYHVLSISIRFMVENTESFASSSRFGAVTELEKAQFRAISARITNSAVCAFKLAKNGFFVQSIALIRDIIECRHLQNLFFIDPGELSPWAKSSEKQRLKAFSAFQVRHKIENKTGYSQLREADFYKKISEYGTHATPRGIGLMADAGGLNIGPFPSSEKFMYCLGQLSMELYKAALVVDATRADKGDNITTELKCLSNALVAIRGRWAVEASGPTSAY